MGMKYKGTKENGEQDCGGVTYEAHGGSFCAVEWCG